MVSGAGRDSQLQTVQVGTVAVSSLLSATRVAKSRMCDVTYDVMIFQYKHIQPKRKMNTVGISYVFIQRRPHKRGEVSEH